MQGKLTAPSNSIMEIKDLLNPAELLRDHILYDSDRVLIGEIELPPSSEMCPIKQDSKVTMNTPNTENQQFADIIETIEDIEARVPIQAFTPLVISQNKASAGTPIDKYMDSLPVKISEDNTNLATPMMKRICINAAKKVPKRKLILNNTVGNGSKSKDQDYVSSMLSHSKLLKDEEHMRRMEIAEEEHVINLKILKEKLKSAILEREILELRKARMQSESSNNY